MKLLLKLSTGALLLLAMATSTLTTQALAERVIIDQIGRKVTLPDTVTSVVALQHQAVNIIVQLNATDTLSGVLENWRRRLGPGFERLAPRLTTLPMPGDLKNVNIESLMAIKPQVVFVTHYTPKEMIDQIESVGIPVVAVSFLDDPDGGVRNMNSKLKDEETAYNNGLKTGITLIGEVINRQKEAAALIAYTFDQRKIVDERMQKISIENRTRIYMARPDLTTYGSGKYTGLMMQHAGGINVAAADMEGSKQVSIEQVLAWNPQVIFVQDRYPEVVPEILTSQAWSVIDAVKNKRVYLMPEYAKAWGHPMPESMAIGELWMAKQLYPEMFADIDLDKAVDAYYQKFYRTSYENAHNGQSK